MPCLVALIVLSILGIFSASHRKLAKEAFACVFRRVTLRPCDTGFDTKVKAMVLGKLINRSPKVAKFVSQRFEILAWGFVILMTVVSIYTLKGMYNVWAWGNCDGPVAQGFCAFDPSSESSKATAIGGEECTVGELAYNALRENVLDTSLFGQIKTGDESTMTFIGCYNCPYTREVYPTLKTLMATKPATYTFVHFPVKPGTDYLMAYDACIWNLDKEKYWDYVDNRFSQPVEINVDEGLVRQELEAMGIDLTKLDACIQSEATQTLVKEQYKQIVKTGIYGTPTAFVNKIAVVGPKPARVYQRLLRGSWF